MKAAIYPGGGEPLEIRTLPDPEPKPGEVLLKVDRCGICGTDLSMTKGQQPWDYGTDAQLGHEYAGEIVALGQGVEHLRIGDRVSVLPSGACGHCHSCQTGANHVLCRDAPGAAVGFAELAAVPASLAIPLPQTLSMADGALVEPLAVSLYGVRQSGMAKGARVVVLGGGTVALYAIYWARRLGAGRIVALSRSDRRRELCLAMGADSYLTYGENEQAEVVEALGGPADIVFECVGSEGLLGKSVQHVGLYGKIISLGFCTAPDAMVPAMAAYKCVTMQYLVGYRMEEFTFIADQLDKGHVDPGLIVTDTVTLDAMPARFASLRGPNTDTKVHVRMA